MFITDLLNAIMSIYSFWSNAPLYFRPAFRWFATLEFVLITVVFCVIFRERHQNSFLVPGYFKQHAYANRERVVKVVLKEILFVVAFIFCPFLFNLLSSPKGWGTKRVFIWFQFVLFESFFIRESLVLALTIFFVYLPFFCEERLHIISAIPTPPYMNHFQVT